MEGRLRFVFILLSLLFFAVILRLFFWQVASSDRLKSAAESQTLTSLTIPAHRGRILASDGSPLVINQPAYLLYIEPHKLKNIAHASEVLAKELSIPQASITASLVDTKLRWIPIADKVDEQKFDKIKKFDLPGVGFIEKSKRYYPEASMAAHILGFVGKNANGGDQGYFGLEGYYDEQLRGRDGRLKLEEDALGDPILSGKLEEIPAEDGRDLYLTIDKTVQFIAESKLKEGIEKYGAKGGSVVVLDPATGAVLAMASFPSYDPGIFSSFATEYYKNPAVASSYEPGSTFKVLVMAAALNEGKVKIDEKYNEEGPIKIGGYSIRTWNQKYHGEINLAKILEYSSNVGMVFVGGKLGQDTFTTYIEHLGFGSLTDIDLQEETSPSLRAKNKWYEIDYATASFGQGVAVTPLQMVRAVASIANGGKLVRPYVVKKLLDSKGKEIETRPKIGSNIFKPEITSVVAEMMAQAVNNGETKFLNPARFRIAGKTGTAEIPISGHYDTDKTITSFVGFAPADIPKFVMLVTLSEPTSSPWGSETAAPIFVNITKELFSYWGISPSY